MAERSDVRPGEVAIELPASYDAGVYFIGRIRTPFKSRAECPKNTAESDAVGRVELDPRYAAGLEDLGLYSHVWLLYWMDQARRDLIQQVPAHLGRPRGTFALRSPVRPNPIALAAVRAARHRRRDAHACATSTASTARRSSTSSPTSPRPTAFPTPGGREGVRPLARRSRTRRRAGEGSDPVTG